MRKVLGVLLQLAVGLGVCAPLKAATTSVSGRLPQFHAVARSDIRHHPGLGVEPWETLPGMAVRFTTTKPGPAVVSFCGNFATGPSAMKVRVVGAGLGEWAPGAVRFRDWQTSPGDEPRCFRWFARELPAGTHKVIAQWLASGTGTFVIHRFLMVEHQN